MGIWILTVQANQFSGQEKLFSAINKGRSFKKYVLTINANMCLLILMESPSQATKS